MNAKLQEIKEKLIHLRDEFEMASSNKLDTLCFLDKFKILYNDFIDEIENSIKTSDITDDFSASHYNLLKSLVSEVEKFNVKNT